MTDTDKMLTPEEIKDTTELQFTSLYNFMYALGYYPVYATLSNLMYFESKHYSNRGKTIVSFQTAVEWHNGGLLHNTNIKFDIYRVMKAFYSKIITTVNLQKSRKTGFIKPTSKFVEFMCPEYYQMWISSKYFPF